MIAQLKQKSDLIGAIASITCMIHCIATPFLFIASAFQKLLFSNQMVDFYRFYIFIHLLVQSTNQLKIHEILDVSALWLAWTLLLMAHFSNNLIKYFSEVYNTSSNISGCIAFIQFEILSM